jgi:hypothetical protein
MGYDPVGTGSVDDPANKPSKNTGGSSPKPKLKQPKSKPKAPKKQSFADKISSGIKSLGTKFKESLNKPANPAVMKAHQDFLKQTSKDSGPSGIASLKNMGVAAAPVSTPEQQAENMKRYQEYLEAQKRKITPDMRQEALNIFESQRGAGQMPYYMAASQGATSPAFQYAAQNYGTLGGAQRLGPRPMEMMSVAERRQINDMAQGMADQQAAANEYQKGVGLIANQLGGLPPRFGGGGKGGPTTMPQGQPMMPTNLPPNYGGMPRPPLPFASMLAQRFGGFGGQ